MSLRQWLRVWYRIGRDVGGPWMGLRNVTAGLRRHIRESGNWPTARRTAPPDPPLPAPTQPATKRNEGDGVKEPLTGIERVRQAIARDGGYEWCDEHRTYRYWGNSSCAAKHADELPRGSFVCAEHGRIHTPDEQAWYCDAVDDEPPTDPGGWMVRAWRRLTCPRGLHTGTGATCSDCGRPTEPTR